MHSDGLQVKLSHIFRFLVKQAQRADLEKSGLFQTYQNCGVLFYFRRCFLGQNFA